MPAISRDDIAIDVTEDGFEGRYTTVGSYTLGFETIAAGMDATDLFKGLPDDACQAEHWGYLFKGLLKIKYADREELIRPGQAYYLPPGHVPVVLEDAELIEFSSTDEYRATQAFIVGKLEAKA